jgi:hypothetical protein
MGLPEPSRRLNPFRSFGGMAASTPEPKHKVNQSTSQGSEGTSRKRKAEENNDTAKKTKIDTSLVGSKRKANDERSDTAKKPRILLSKDGSQFESEEAAAAAARKTAWFRERFAPPDTPEVAAKKKAELEEKIARHRAERRAKFEAQAKATAEAKAKANALTQKHNDDLAAKSDTTAKRAIATKKSIGTPQIRANSRTLASNNTANRTTASNNKSKSKADASSHKSSTVCKGDEGRKGDKADTKTHVDNDETTAEISKTNSKSGINSKSRLEGLQVREVNQDDDSDVPMPAKRTQELNQADSHEEAASKAKGGSDDKEAAAPAKRTRRLVGAERPFTKGVARKVIKKKNPASKAQLEEAEQEVVGKAPNKRATPTSGVAGNQKKAAPKKACNEPSLSQSDSNSYSDSNFDAPNPPRCPSSRAEKSTTKPALDSMSATSETTTAVAGKKRKAGDEAKNCSKKLKFEGNNPQNCFVNYKHACFMNSALHALHCVPAFANLKNENREAIEADNVLSVVERKAAFARDTRKGSEAISKLQAHLKAKAAREEL